MEILIAEDDKVCRKTLQLHLKQLGHEVRSSGSGTEAWMMFQKDPLPLIISDWMMDDGDGLELCRNVRSRHEKNYTYFILLTSRSGKANYEEAMEAGVDDFLNKPMNRKDLSIRLRVADRILGYAREVNRLKDLLPICMYCKRVRDDEDYWHQLEFYIRDFIHTDLTHGVCPDCYVEQMKVLDEKLKARART